MSTNHHDFTIIIPARYDAKRLPGKPLKDINGKTLLERAYLQAKATGAKQVVIATDDARIEQAAYQFGSVVCKTDKNHPTGSDRIAEACQQLALQEEEIVVNWQGDIPFLAAHEVSNVVEKLVNNPNCQVATLMTPIKTIEQLRDPNCVKVVVDKNDRALYFSRAVIPYSPPEIDSLFYQYYHHMGLYVFRVGALAQFATWPRGRLEKAEKLEQLRFLENGQGIVLHCSEQIENLELNTESDLQSLREFFRQRETLNE